MKLSEILDVLDADLLSGQEQLDKDFLAVGASDLMSDILAGLAEECIFLTGLTTIQTIRTAVISGIGAIVFVRNKKPAQELIDMANKEKIPLLSSPYSMFVSCGRLHAKGLTGLDGTR